MCKLCEKNPVYEFTNKRKLCKLCFIRYMQKKFFYIIRKFKMVSREDTIGYKNKKDFRDVVLRDLLEVFSEKARIDLIKLPSIKKISKVAISDTLDLSANKVIYELVDKKIKDLKELKPVDKKIIKPLYLFLDQEILLYAKLKKLKYKKIVQKKNKWNDFIGDLEKKHPEIKRGIVNSYLELYY